MSRDNRPPVFKFTILGMAESGKTAFATQLVCNAPPVVYEHTASVSSLCCEMRRPVGDDDEDNPVPPRYGLELQDSPGELNDHILSNTPEHDLISKLDDSNPRPSNAALRAHTNRSRTAEHAPLLDRDNRNVLVQARPSRAYCVLFDLTSDKSFSKAKRIVSKIRLETATIPILLFGNKLDLCKDDDPDVQRRQRQAEDFADDNDALFRYGSVINNDVVLAVGSELQRQELAAVIHELVVRVGSGGDEGEEEEQHGTEGGVEKRKEEKEAMRSCTGAAMPAMKVEDAIRLVAAERGVDEDTLKRVAKVEAFEPADAVRPKRMTLSDLSGPWGEEPFELQGAAAEMVPDRSVWRPERMKERWGGCKVDVGGESRIEVFLDSFLDYADRIETKYSVADPAEEDPDASPLYVFDPRFIEALPGVEEGYRVLPPLAMDLADAVYKGHDDQREDHKWLLIGPHGTGYGMHRDPASTSSWNLLIHGRKHWILLPPHVPQDVVLPPDCGPIVQRSATAWMHHVRRRAYQRAKEEGWPWMEFEQDPGSLVFVPEGWWHIVLNVDLCVAVTHNFMSAPTFAKGLRASMANQEHDFACGMWAHLGPETQAAVRPWIDASTVAELQKGTA